MSRAFSVATSALVAGLTLFSLAQARAAGCWCSKNGEFFHLSQSECDAIGGTGYKSKKQAVANKLTDLSDPDAFHTIFAAASKKFDTKEGYEVRQKIRGLDQRRCNARFGYVRIDAENKIALRHRFSRCRRRTDSKDAIWPEQFVRAVRIQELPPRRYRAEAAGRLLADAHSDFRHRRSKIQRWRSPVCNVLK